jgi:aryl-alcohol dehydrogenase-like predicted oxidoreductase
MGTMQFGWTTDETHAFEVLDAFVESGGNFLDTADVYTRWFAGNPGGVAEQIIGRWMKDRGNRHELVVATKVRGQMGPGPNDVGLSRKHILDAVEASLRRLQIDYIDLYQAHSDDPDLPLD